MKAKLNSLPVDSENPALDISSLIDVCFLLLIYFIATSTIVPAERDLDMNLPGNQSGQFTTVIEPLLIRIEGNGEILTGSPQAMMVMDRDPAIRMLPLLGSHLLMMAETAKAVGGELVVQIEASDDCQHQRVIDVLNALAQAKIDTVAFRDLISEA